ncbi:VTT domain-containing protein [Clostridioides difficile]
MKSKKILYSIVAVAIIIVMTMCIFLFKDNITIDFSIDKLRLWIESKQFSEILFILLWSLRLVLFIPGVTLMILGGVIFEPDKAFILSLVGIVLSDTLVFSLARSRMLSGLRNKISLKYPEIISMIESYSYKILGVGVLCPVAPTDVIVFLSSYIGMKFSRFLIIFSTANIPALFLYSYLGESFQGSSMNTVFIVVTLAISAVLSIRLWNDLRRRTITNN